MTKVTIDRELLERACALWSADMEDDGTGRAGWLPHVRQAVAELRSVLATSRQPEGEGLEVVAYQSLDATRGGGWMAHKHALPQSHIDQGALQEPLCRLSDAQRAIAELRGECSFLKDCQENAMLHMTGLVAARDTLRQRLAELQDEVKQLKGESFEGLYNAVIDQRDKLAGLLREAHSAGRSRRLTVDELYRIDAALAEIQNAAPLTISTADIQSPSNKD